MWFSYQPPGRIVFVSFYDLIPIKRSNKIRCGLLRLYSPTTKEGNTADIGYLGSFA